MSAKPKAKKRARLELFRNSSGAWWWHLKAANGRLVAMGGEGFTRKRDCAKSALNVALIFMAQDTQLFVDGGLIEFDAL